MKRLFLASLVSATLIGCGGSDGSDKKPTAPENQAPSVEITDKAPIPYTKTKKILLDVSDPEGDDVEVFLVGQAEFITLLEEEGKYYLNVVPRGAEDIGIHKFRISASDGELGVASDYAIKVIYPLIPLEPSTPVEPETPDEPLIPLEPSTPVVPEQPLIPLEPSKPVKPLTPLEPSTPVEPEVEDEPLTPLEPSTPLPTEPCGENGECLEDDFEVVYNDLMGMGLTYGESMVFIQTCLDYNMCVQEGDAWYITLNGGRYYPQFKMMSAAVLLGSVDNSAHYKVVDSKVQTDLMPSFDLKHKTEALGASIGDLWLTAQVDMDVINFQNMSASNSELFWQVEIESTVNGEPEYYTQIGGITINPKQSKLLKLLRKSYGDNALNIAIAENLASGIDVIDEMCESGCTAYPDGSVSVDLGDHSIHLDGFESYAVFRTESDIAYEETLYTTTKLTIPAADISYVGTGYIVESNITSGETTAYSDFLFTPELIQAVDSGELLEVSGDINDTGITFSGNHVVENGLAMDFVKQYFN